MSTEIRIVSAGPEDIETIALLALKIWPDVYLPILPPDQVDYMLDLIYSIPALRQKMLEEHHAFILLYFDGEPVAFASYGITDLPLIYKLHKLYVLSEMNGKGFGKLLIQYVLDRVAALGGSALRLNVNRNNKAIHFYEKMGFEVIAEEDIDIGQGYFMNDFIMEKKWPPRFLNH